MRERLTALFQSATARIAPAVAQVQPYAARAGAIAGQTGATIARTARTAARMSRTGLDRSLALIERTLLSPKGRERLHASSVFALIFAFGVMSVDMLITGGPELISSARAATAESPRVDLIASSSLPRDGAVQLASAEVSGPAVIPEERVAQREPQAVRLLRPTATEVPELVDAAAPTKAEPEVPAAPTERIKAEA